jgi:Outer membrane protein beta-barrel domain
MKKLITCFYLCVSFICFAQTKSNLSFGVHAGLNSSWLTSTNQNLNLGISPSVGLQFFVPIKGNWSFQTETNYLLAKPSIPGVQRSNGNIVQEFKADFSIHYFDLPIFINYTFFKKKNWRFSSGLGCDFKYGFSGKVDAQIKVGQPPTQTVYSGPSIELSDDTDFILVSPSIQASVAYKFQNNKEISLCLRYSRSIKDALPSGPSTPPEISYNYGFAFSESKLQTLTLFAAYQFGFE